MSWVSTTSIKITPGYGEDAGEYWEILPADAYVTTGFALTGLTTTTNGIVQYIYIDKTNSLLPAVTLINSTTAPTWSDANQGWYNSQNRCIGAIWVKPDGTVATFTCTGDTTYILDYTSATILLLQDQNISTTRDTLHTFDMTAFVPANAYGVRIADSMWGTWSFCMAEVRANSGTHFTNYGITSTVMEDWALFPRGVTKSIQYQAWASSASGNEQIVIHGYEIER